MAKTKENARKPKQKKAKAEPAGAPPKSEEDKEVAAVVKKQKVTSSGPAVVTQKETPKDRPASVNHVMKFDIVAFLMKVLQEKIPGLKSLQFLKGMTAGPCNISPCLDSMVDSEIKFFATGLTIRKNEVDKTGDYPFVLKGGYYGTFSMGLSHHFGCDRLFVYKPKRADEVRFRCPEGFKIPDSVLGVKVELCS
eukprot:NODE_4630_length_782_cov_25.182810_g4287_i0.p1 GENE.NODE_4630_length_782_cov_25.182810_g4287_i0~~NODE_4630_length_782_cov_25.182810_g4287_i0.p1  ORF type:complete len:194 (+),score=42.64 NODE_4630_length_782_cov_25.182810_g4287_i0:82-663(+)